VPDAHTLAANNFKKADIRCRATLPLLAADTRATFIIFF